MSSQQALQRIGNKFITGIFVILTQKDLNQRSLPGGSPGQCLSRQQGSLLTK
jgi:hypothetical protein